MRLYQSNRLENLLAALCAVLAEPTSSVLAPEIIVVQNPGMARWLSQQIALRTGICANISFPLPASFVWSLFAKTLGGLPDLSEFSREVLLWRILAELDSLLDLPSMEEIRTYLHDDRDGRRRFQLAEKITDLFDQYLVYRPDMALAWEKGQEQHWQAQLWRRLTEGGGKHRAEVLERFLLAAKQGTLRTEGLPERVCVFGINSLAPVYLEVISRISRHIDIRIFHFSPCRQAWDDIMPERLIALRRQSWRRRGSTDLSRYYSSGNPLLASLGSLGREFFKLLMETHPIAEEQDLYEIPSQDTLLGQIQGDILDLRDRGKGELLLLHLTDHSIRFHCCHSPMREIQVLHDRLLDLFAADPQLQPADILVMAPDISRYAPAVAGVFGSAGSTLRIPWSIADQPRREEQPVLDGFLGILGLLSSRCTTPEVMAVLENPVILTCFSLSEQNVPLLRRMITAAGIRLGLEQRSGHDVLYTWEAGINRLLLGCLTGPLAAPWQGIMPISGSMSEDEEWLGNLAEFLRQLQRLRRQVARPLSPANWATFLLRLVTTFLDNGTSSQHEEGVLLLRQSIADFAENCRQAGFGQPLSLAIVRRHFQQILAAPAGGQAFLAGRVTFCNMVPMRSVPFKVIWLLGMNDGDFPRSQHPPAFDLMAEHRRPGDRSRRDDDRYLFLEALLSARTHLAISWVGRDLRDNKPRPPSVTVAELRDYINRGWRTEDNTAAAAQLTVEHPLQPFSRQCFTGNAAVASYRTEWLPAAPEHSLTFTSQPLPQPEQFLRQIDLHQLVRFWKHPVRFFLEQRLGLRPTLSENLLPHLPESETFVLEQLQHYQLAAQMIHELRNGRIECTTLFHQHLAAGELPGSCFGHLLHQKIHTETTQLINTVEPLLAQPVEPAEVSLTIDGIRLTGQLTSLCRCGRVTFRPARLKANDLLQLWIHHLALLMLQPAGVEPRSVHAAKDETISFQEVADPQDKLARLIHLFHQGICTPLRFYPETSWAWLEKAHSRPAAMEAARKAWLSSYYKGEGDDPAYEIGLRGHAPLDQQFEELAEILRAALEHREKKRR
ncbi:exodeoxyribonuclease V subunit gamma [Candidatus Electronema sp. PJ]|uniref:exodeoxyribonuclease V subunit gamma n=1 Tax=Candidatus Electronema sp. PJ TaxID=3401572 RepID=UPI003AA84873